MESWGDVWTLLVEQDCNAFRAACIATVFHVGLSPPGLLLIAAVNDNTSTVLGKSTCAVEACTISGPRHQDGLAPARSAKAHTGLSATYPVQMHVEP